MKKPLPPSSCLDGPVISWNPQTKEYIRDCSKGIKYDKDKPRMELLPPAELQEVAGVLTAGAVKYDTMNWAKGLDVSRLLGSLKRHISSFEQGVDIDEETGYSHMAHAACNVLFIMWMMNNKPEHDDRPFKGETND